MKRHLSQRRRGAEAQRNLIAFFSAPLRLCERCLWNFIMSRIAIASPQEAVPIDRGRMREIARAVLDGENQPQAEISLAFVDNTTIHTLNKRYLQHDEPTDVLSFPLSEPGTAKLSG